MRYLTLALLLTFAAMPAYAAKDTKAVKLQVLNKINAAKTEVIAQLDKKTITQDLEIRLKRCRKSGTLEKQENRAMLEIYDIAKGTRREQYFNGWMFSSSPAISAMDHPIYDVIVISCVDQQKI